MCATLRAFLSSGGVFIDLGANEGYFSVLASRLVGEGGRVIVIEPQDRLMRVIEKNFSLNAVANATVVRAAISDHRGDAKFFLTPEINTGGSALVRTTKYPVPTQNVALTTLSDLLQGLAIDRVDLIKIDIEGAEYEAVLGSPDVFREKRIGAIALELHPGALKRRGKSVEEITDFLRSSGYRLDDKYSNSVWLA